MAVPVAPSRRLRPLLEAPWLTRDPETARAVAATLTALAAEDWALGLAAIDYAQRRSPGDGTLTFALAELCLQCGQTARAADIYAFLAEKTGWGEALRRLAACGWRAGDRTAAQAALGRALSAHAPPPDAEFRTLASAIAADRGWCGLDNAGRVTLAGTGPCSVWLDGVRVAARRGVRPVPLPGAWATAAWLRIEAAAEAPLGSPIAVASVTRVEGFAAATLDGGIEGWCWYPAEPWREPGVAVGGRVLAARDALAPDQANPFAEPRGFALPPAEAALLGPVVEVTGPHEKRLYGAPLSPGAEAAAAAAIARALARGMPVQPGSVPPPDGALEWAAMPAALAVPLPPRPQPDLARRRTLVVVPVYLGREATRACLDSLLAAREEFEDLLVVVDASPDPEIGVMLAAMAGSGDFSLLMQPDNRGFPATANVGLRAAAGRDVVLLNNDTLVAPGWLRGLRAAVYAAPDIGTATPLSNAATIFSYPAMNEVNPVPDLAATRALQALAQAAEQGAPVEVPTAHGFCMYVRWECLLDTGLLRETMFAQGYGEENDFSLRARHLGWRHVAAAGVFVGHRESVSFGAARQSLIVRNLAILNRLHPGYEAMVARWIAADPLLPARQRIDRLRWRHDQGARAAVALVTLDRSGGVARHVGARVREIARLDDRPLVIRPKSGKVAIDAGDAQAYPSLVFDPECERAALLDFLRECRVREIEIHHFLGHRFGFIEALTREFPVYDVVLHDYAWYCPRITLTAQNERYCGEPEVQQCALCVADHGSNLEETIAPAALHQRSLQLFRAARAVIAPSADTARRYGRRFGIAIKHAAWEDESRPLLLRPIRKAPGAMRRIAVVGAISYQKGYDLLLQAARLTTAKKLPLEFVVVGFTADDRRLLAAGSLRITGPFKEDEAEAAIRAEDADFAFLPAQWPETWSYVLSQIWQAGLPVVALDIGAPAERIRARQGGILLPPHLPVERLVGVFMEPGLFRGK